MLNFLEMSLLASFLLSKMILLIILGLESPFIYLSIIIFLNKVVISRDLGFQLFFNVLVIGLMRFVVLVRRLFVVVIVVRYLFV